MDGRVLMRRRGAAARAAARVDDDVDVGGDVRAQAGPDDATADAPLDLHRVDHISVIPSGPSRNLTYRHKTLTFARASRPLAELSLTGLSPTELADPAARRR